MPRFGHLLSVLLLAAACDSEPPPQAPATEPPAAAVVPAFDFDTRRDYQSYAEPEAYVTRHLDLDLTVDFVAKALSGTAMLGLEPKARGPLVLDTRDLTIEQVEAAAADGTWQPTDFSLGGTDELLGTPLTIGMPPGADRVRIRYRTSPDASGL